MWSLRTWTWMWRAALCCMLLQTCLLHNARGRRTKAGIVCFFAFAINYLLSALFLQQGHHTMWVSVWCKNTHEVMESCCRLEPHGGKRQYLVVYVYSRERWVIQKYILSTHSNLPNKYKNCIIYQSYRLPGPYRPLGYRNIAIMQISCQHTKHRLTWKI